MLRILKDFKEGKKLTVSEIILNINQIHEKQNFKDEDLEDLYNLSFLLMKTCQIAAAMQGTNFDEVMITYF